MAKRKMGAKRNPGAPLRLIDTSPKPQVSSMVFRPDVQLDNSAVQDMRPPIDGMSTREFQNRKRRRQKRT
jgi:hypothetical protein